MVPGLSNAQHRYIAALEEAVVAGTHWLDVGCGHRLLPDWMREGEDREQRLVERAGRAVGVDMDEPSLVKNRVLKEKVKATAERLPFADGSFDLVTANMVVEHVTDPPKLLMEVMRVLRPGGHLMFHTPNLLNPVTLCCAWMGDALKRGAAFVLEGRRGEDVFPAYYRMNTRRGIRSLAEAAGFKVEQVLMVESGPEFVMLGPVVAIELAWIRASRAKWLAGARQNLIVTLNKDR